MVVITVFFVSGCSWGKNVEDDQVDLPEISTLREMPKQNLEDTSEEWKFLRKSAIEENGASEEYIDKHYEYLSMENKPVTGDGEYTYVNYRFNIMDNAGYVQSVEMSDSMRDFKLMPPFFMGYPDIELETIISRDEAITAAKESGKCDDIKDENNIRLADRDPVGASGAPEPNFGFVWDWRGAKGRCFVDPETRAVEYKVYSTILLPE